MPKKPVKRPIQRRARKATKRKKTVQKRPWRETPDWLVDMIQYCYHKLEMSAREVSEVLGNCSSSTIYKYTQIPNRWNRRPKWVIRLERFDNMPEPDISCPNTPY